MKRVVPDYYNEFRCISSRCQHNCCIGWEIDIDPDTNRFYEGVPGEFGERLRANISTETEPCFILGKDERCPFLNSRNLCDIITTLGEERLCAICAEHPRFHNELPDRVESGLGLCCEEAGRIILTRSEPMRLVVSNDTEDKLADDADPDEILMLRDELIAILQNRGMTIPERISRMQFYCRASLPELSLRDWAEFLCGLEQLDDQWTQLLGELAGQYISIDFDGFDRFMTNRQTEYEQLLVYMIYRHFANAPSFDYISARANFAALAYLIIHSLGAMIWTRTGSFTVEQQINLARMFSSEIEYSDENLCILFDELDTTDID